jgi:hypothetical protein
MSPAEYFELINIADYSASSHAMNAVTIYCAYLVATYLVGSKLTFFQAVALTAIYSAFFTLPTLASLNSIKLVMVHIQQFQAAHPDLYQVYSSDRLGIFKGHFFYSYVLYTISIVWVVAWILSILFMVSKRRDGKTST